MPRTECPVCGSTGLADFVDVAKMTGQPRYALQRHLSRAEAMDCLKEDVHFVFCRKCTFTFNRNFNPEVMDYEEDIDTSRGHSDYFNRYIQNVCEQVDEAFSISGKNVVEIGCGDGQFLIELRKLARFSGWGFDPSMAKSTSPPSCEDVVFTPTTFQGSTSAIRVDVVVLRHVLEHIADGKGFLSGVLPPPDKETLQIYVEVPSWDWIIDNDQVMMFSNDHCSYYSEKSLRLMLSRCGFECQKVTVAFEDEYLQYFGQRSGLQSGESDAEQATPLETGAESSSLEAKTIAFVDRMQSTLQRFRSLFDEVEGRVVLWGAGGKGTVLLPTLGISHEQMPFVIDSNPNKHGTFIPVSGQEVVSPSQLPSIRPDYVLITNPSYRQEIVESLSALGVAAEVVTVQ